MPNRILKEGICTSSDIDNLTYFQEAFFYRLIVNCDDFGRFDGRTAILKARLFPLKNLKEGEVETSLEILARENLIERYVHEGKPYIQLKKWSQHQQVRNKRSKYPDPDEGEEIVQQPKVEEPEKVKAKSKPKESKLNFSENVTMTQKEYDTLLEKYGEEATKALIEKLDVYKTSTGKVYKSDYSTMASWVIKAVAEEKPYLFRQQQQEQTYYEGVYDPRKNPYAKKEENNGGY